MALTNKVVPSPDEAITGVTAGMSVHVGGWGGTGIPKELIRALARLGVGDLKVTTNNCGQSESGDVGELFAAGLVSKVYTTFPVSPKAVAFREQLDAGRVEVELVPQGTLAERLRAAGAGIAAFYTPTAAGTALAQGKEIRLFRDREHVLELALPGDFALIRAWQADSFGNLRFRNASRAFSPLMAMAGRVTVVQADTLVPLGSIAPDDVHLSGVFVDRVWAKAVA